MCGVGRGGSSGCCQHLTCALPCRDLRRGPVKLGMAKVTHVDFPPREVVSYTKETQTPVMTEQKEGEVAHAPRHTPTELTRGRMEICVYASLFNKHFQQNRTSTKMTQSDYAQL